MDQNSLNSKMVSHFNSAENEDHERSVFGAVTKVEKFGANDLQIAVYGGNVANLTFTSDFILMHKVYGEITVNNLITLLFVQTKGKWFTNITHLLHHLCNTLKLNRIYNFV